MSQSLVHKFAHADEETRRLRNLSRISRAPKRNAQPEFEPQALVLALSDFKIGCRKTTSHHVYVAGT